MHPPAVKYKGGCIRYGSTVAADEARRLGQYLETNSCRLLNVGVQKKAGTFQLKVPGAEEQYQDVEVLVAYRVLAAALSEEIFAGAAVEVHLCDSWFLTLTVIPSSGQEFGCAIPLQYSRNLRHH